MTESHTDGGLSLPSSVIRIELEGRQVYLVGTAHVSKSSVEDVQTTLDQIRPDTVCVELCEPRFRGLNVHVISILTDEDVDTAIIKGLRRIGKKSVVI